MDRLGMDDQPHGSGTRHRSKRRRLATSNHPTDKTSQLFTHNIARDGSHQILNNTGTVNIRQTTNHEEEPPDTIFSVPDLLSPHFVGRTAGLAEIQDVFDRRIDESLSRCVIWGMPGLGKTQLALKYASSAYQQKRFQYVFWVSASSTEKIQQDFIKLLELVCYPGRANMDQATKLAVAKTWLEGHKSGLEKEWLLIIDNVNQETSKILKELMPPSSPKGHVLITTRTEQVAKFLSFAFGTENTYIGLQQLSVEDASALFLKSANQSLTGTTDRTDTEEVEKLVKAVGYLPLAVDQAASFMRESDCSARQILATINGEEAEEIFEWENDLSQYEEKSVSATFTLSLKQLNDAPVGTKELLCVMSFMDPEQISLDVFINGIGGLRGAGSEEDEEGLAKLGQLTALLQSTVKLAKATQILQRLSLAVKRGEKEEQALWIHDLVQLILRTKLMDASEQKKWLARAIRMVEHSFRGVEYRRLSEAWFKCEKYVAHFHALSRHADELQIESKELLSGLHWVAIYFYECGRYDEALKLDQNTLEMRKQIFGAEHPDTLMSMNNLASVYRAKGRLDEAESLETQLLEIRKRVNGVEHIDTLISMNNLAVTYRAKGEWDKAEPLDIQTLETMTRVLGAEHQNTMMSMNNLASTYQAKKQLDKAEPLYLQTMETMKRVLGPEHPDTLMSMNNLGSTYWHKGKLDEAVSLYTQIIETSKRVLGPEHPSTLIGMNNLATGYWYTGQWDESEALGVHVMEVRKRVLGPEHPNTLDSMNNVAQTWKRMGRDEDARKLMATCCELSEKTLGPHHPDTKSSKATLISWEEKDTGNLD